MSRRTRREEADRASAGDAPSGRPAAGVRVVWERLRLEGFGRHDDLVVAFPDGLGVWAAPNEAGKSTALLGLVAVLWGLPHVQERDGFTWARFRPWGGGALRGEVTLRSGDERFTVRRAFDQHRVRVVAHREDGDEVVVDATHNPNARKETTPYLPWLQAHLGLSDADQVLATFIVAQGDLGGARHALDANVQSLVAGAGGGWTAARTHLEEALRARTRRLRALDAGFPSDGRNDRALEEAEARVADLEAAIEAGRRVADAYEGAQREVAAAETRRGEARAARERWAATVAAQRAWLERRDATARALRRLAGRERAAATARERVAAAVDARARARGVHPELAAADERLEPGLEAWAAAVAALEERRAQLAAARGERDAAVRAAHDAVAAALDAVAAVPAPSRDWSAWARPEGAIPTTAAADGGPRAAAVADVRRAVERWRRGLAEARGARHDLAAAEAQLAPLRVFDGWSDADAAEVRAVAAREAAWAARVDDAEAALGRARARVAEHELRFGPVRMLEDAARTALRVFERAHDGPDGSGAARWLGALAWCLALGLGAPRLAAALDVALPAAAGWGAGGLAAVLWVALLPRRPALRRARRRLAALAGAGAFGAAEAALGQALDDDAARLELARRLDAFDALADDVARDEGELDEAERRASEARDGAAAFAAAWTDVRTALIAAGAAPDVDLGDAHARHAQAGAAAAAARGRLAAALATLGVDDADALAPEAAAAAAGGDGARATAWARFQGAVEDDGATVAAVAAWLDRLGAATWARWTEEAAEADAWATRRAAADAARRDAETAAGQVAAAQERAVRHAEKVVAAAEVEAAAARGAVVAALGVGGAAVVDAWGDDPRVGRAAWRVRQAAWGDAERAAFAAAAHLEAIADEEGGASVGSAAAHGDARGPADPAAVPRGAAPAVGAAAGSRAAAPDDGVLAEGVAAAEARERAARVAAGTALAAWEALVADHPDLPPADPDRADEGGVGAAFAAAGAALADAERAATAADQAYLDAREALLRWQGADPVDVAAAEVERVAARRDVARLQGERDALAIALRTLDAAVEDFRGAHAARLERAAGAAFAGFSGVAGRRVRLDEGFAAHVVEPTGDEAVPAQLSQGARDQLAIALRLAVADLLADDVRLPLVFDDPFLNWDEARSARLAAALQALARDRQVIVLTHREALAGWGTALQVSGG